MTNHTPMNVYRLCRTMYSHLLGLGYGGHEEGGVMNATLLPWALPTPRELTTKSTYKRLLYHYCIYYQLYPFSY